MTGKRKNRDKNINTETEKSAIHNPEKSNNDVSLSFREHFLELRKRVVLSILLLSVFSVCGFIFHRWIIRILLNQSIGINEFTSGKPVFTNITEFWSVVMRVSLLTGVILSIPFITYQIMVFIIPGLRDKEKKYIYVFFPEVLMCQLDHLIPCLQFELQVSQ